MPPLYNMNITEWLTLALVVITACYVVATFQILRANQEMVLTMRKQQDAAMRPYILVSAYVRIGTNLIYLSIKNVGKSGALSLKLTMSKKFHQFNRDKSNIADSTAFTQIIESLPPDGQLIFLLGSGPQLFASNPEDLRPLVFQVTASYSSGSESITEQSTIDLRPYINSDIPQDPICDEFGKLRASFEELTKVIESKKF